MHHITPASRQLGHAYSLSSSGLSANGLLAGEQTWAEVSCLVEADVLSSSCRACLSCALLEFWCKEESQRSSIHETTPYPTSALKPKMKETESQFFVLCFAIKEVVKVSLGDCSGVGDGGNWAHCEDRRQQRRAADDSAQCEDALPRTCLLESTSSSGCYRNSILQILAASCCRRPG